MSNDIQKQAEKRVSGDMFGLFRIEC